MERNANTVALTDIRGRVAPADFPCCHVPLMLPPLLPFDDYGQPGENGGVIRPLLWCNSPSSTLSIALADGG